MNAKLALWLPAALMLGAGLLGCAGAPAAPEGPRASIPDGTWEGALDVSGTKLKMVLRVKDGVVLLDVPQQNATGIKAEAVEAGAKAGEVVIRFRSINASFPATWIGEELSGQWEQGGGKLPLVLRRTSAAAAAPAQAPSPAPGAASSAPGDEVRFPGGADGVTLAGTLVLPEGKGPFPAVILITGSGPQDRDETVFGKKPFAVLARIFAAKGIASLRYDDRGIAASTGDFASATSADFARDAEAALRFLKADARIRPDGIGYAGHSEGGLVALLAAVTPALPEKAKPAFVASISGPMDKGIDILLGQSAAILRASGADEKTVEAARSINSKVYNLILSSEKYPEAEISALLESAGLSKEVGKAQSAALSSAWYKAFLASDPGKLADALRLPLVAYFADKDLQVPYETNAARAEKAAAAIRTAGFPAVVRVWPDMNHMYQKTRTGLPQEYATLEGDFAEEVAAALADTILSFVK